MLYTGRAYSIFLCNGRLIPPQRLRTAGSNWTFVSRELPSTGVERGFSAAQLFPTIALALAGGGQGRLPRSGQYRVGIRARRPVAHLRDAPAFSDQPQGIRSNDATARLHTVQRIPTRPVCLPILRRRSAF